MTITLRQEQQQVLIEPSNPGLAETANEAIDHALEALKSRRPHKGSPDESVAGAVRRLATFGKPYGLSLGGLTIKELLRQSRP
jgi:hypothetical protein